MTAVLTTGGVIETARLRLRPLRPEDAAILPALVTEKVSALTANWLYPFTPEMAEERVAKTIAANDAGTFYNRIIENRNDSRPMGWIGIALINPVTRTGSLGYWLSDDFHGHGYITEALRPFVQAAIDALQLEEVEAGAQHRNSASIAALLRLGMTYTGDRMIFVPSRQRESLTAFYRLDMSAFRPSR